MSSRTAHIHERFRVLHKGGMQQAGSAREHICTIKSAEDVLSMATTLCKPVLQSSLFEMTA